MFPHFIPIIFQLYIYIYPLDSNMPSVSFCLLNHHVSSFQLVKWPFSHCFPFYPWYIPSNKWETHDLLIKSLCSLVKHHVPYVSHTYHGNIIIKYQVNHHFPTYHMGGFLSHGGSPSHHAGFNTKNDHPWMIWGYPPWLRKPSYIPIISPWNPFKIIYIPINSKK